MNVRVRELSGIKALSAASPTSEDVALINTHFAPVPMAAEEMHVRPARVAHNQHDRTLERFPKAYLERFAETLPGKSLLPGHDTGALPLGRWFRADTRTRQEQFPSLVNPPREAQSTPGVEIVPGFEPQLRKVTWLEAAFYFTADPSTEGLRKNIDSGVYQDVSIGFSFDQIDCDICAKSYLGDCPHWRGQRLDDGRLVTLTYSGDPQQVEARETSIVYLGAQQHAELMKSLRSGTVDPHRYALTPLGEDLVRLKDAEALARKFGHQQKSWAFPALHNSAADAAEQPSLGGTDLAAGADAATAPPGEHKMEFLKQAAKALGLSEDATEEQVLAAVAEAGKATPPADYEQVKQQAQEAAAQVEKLTPLSKVGTQALQDLKQAILDDDLRLTGKAEPSAELLEIVNLHATNGNYDRLKAIADEKAAAVLEKFPAEPKGRVDHEEPKQTAPTRPRDYALV